jgi:hypothetical protein
MALSSWKNLIFLPVLLLAVEAIMPPTMAQSGTALPMTLGFDEGYGSITVPDRDTTAPAYGGRLRVYDVHIAKMVEVTHHLCKNRRVSPGIIWNYRADNGRIDMGQFNISCRLANDLATAYGLGTSEFTTINYSMGESGIDPQNFSIPVLNLTGNKIDRWINFVQGFKPKTR